MNLTELKQAVVLEPSNASARYELAEAYFADGSLAEAEKQLNQAIALSPGHENATRLLLRVQQQRGAAAGSASAKLLIANPAHWAEAAEQFARAQRYDDAILYGQAARRETALDADGWLQIAQWCRQARLIDRARLALARALWASHGAAAVLEERASLLRDIGEVESADVFSEAQPGPLLDALEAIVAGDAAGAKRALVLASDGDKKSKAFGWLRAELFLAEGNTARADAVLAAMAPSAWIPGRLARRLKFDVPGQIGVLGWTPVGGAVSPLEAVAVVGHGTLQFTGNVGPTGREAGLVAYTCLKAQAAALGIDGLIASYDLHLHFTDTEMGKEGVSSGLALTLAGLSAFRRRPLVPRLGATGAITLHGEVQRIEGLYEKAVAARLAGVRRVIYPRENLHDVRQLPSLVTDAVEFLPVSTLAEAIKVALRPAP